MIYTWWKGTQLSKFYNITEKECFQHGKDLIEGGIRQNIPIIKQIRTYLFFLNHLKKRKDNNQPIYQSDHRLGFHSLMALCYLKIVNIDDGDTGLFFAPKVKKKKAKTSPVKPTILEESVSSDSS